ncbi:MAG: DapH/DapD/GlmU-related protein [Candidatus Scalinduaceae bacterium]
MKIIIIGIGSTAYAVSELLDLDSNFKLVGFIGTTEEAGRIKNGSLIHKRTPLLGDHSILPRLKEGGILGFVVAIGDNCIREAAFYEACSHGLVPINLVSSKAIVDNSVKFTQGVIVSPGVIISPGVEIGSNTILDPGVIVGVNCFIGENCYLHAGVVICAGSRIEKNVMVSARAVIGPDITVGKNQLVDAGKVVSTSLGRLYREDKRDDS